MNLPEAVKTEKLIQAEIAAMIAAQGQSGADLRAAMCAKLEAIPALVRSIRPYAYGRTDPELYTAVADVLYNFDQGNRSRVAVALGMDYDDLITLLCGYVLGAGD